MVDHGRGESVDTNAKSIDNDDDGRYTVKLLVIIYEQDSVRLSWLRIVEIDVSTLTVPAILSSKEWCASDMVSIDHPSNIVKLPLFIRDDNDSPLGEEQVNVFFDGNTPEMVCDGVSIKLHMQVICNNNR